MEIWARPEIIVHSKRLLESFRRWAHRDLLPGSADSSRLLFNAPFIVVSHGTEANPVLNYGNAIALELWEMDWGRFTRTPSRETAEPMHRDERAEFMRRVVRDGIVTGYRGIRISSTGKRFAIEDAIIWNVLDEQQRVIGQAATFSRWTPLPAAV